VKHFLQRFLRRSSSPRPRRSPARRPGLAVEALEERAVPTTFWVTNTLDDGSPGSLRYAMTQANTHPNGGGPNVIDFDIGSGGAQSIGVHSPLPAIFQPLIIDGYTQPGHTDKPLIELNGSGFEGDGLDIFYGASSCSIRGLVINGFLGAGIYSSDGIATTVQGCYIGTDLSGTVARGNGEGVRIQGTRFRTGASWYFSIGTPGGGGNVISGNKGYGVVVENSSYGQVQGNWIGTDRTGTLHLGNQMGGVALDAEAPGTSVHGNAIGGNTIAFNGGDGVVAYGSTSGNPIRGNSIYGNADLGIDLALYAPSPAAAPLLLAAVSSSTTGTTTLAYVELVTYNYSPYTVAYTIDFYATAPGDWTGIPQGQRYIGSAAVIELPYGGPELAVGYLAPTARGEIITATVTDSAGTTSEFSASFTAA
jgi:hypothetical protein